MGRKELDSTEQLTLSLSRYFKIFQDISEELIAGILTLKEWLKECL